MNPILLNLILFISFVAFLQMLPLNYAQKKSISIYFSFFLLVFFHTFVDIYSVPDLEPYYQDFELIKQYSWKQIIGGYVSTREVGFILFLKLISSIGGDFRLVLFAISLLIIVPYYKVLNKYSPYAFLSIILILITTFNQSIFVLRQHAAISVSIFSYQYILSNKLWKYIIAVFLAFSFHKTAILFAPIYFIYNIKRRKNIIATISLIALIFVFFFSIFYNSFGANMGYDSYIEDTEHKTNYVGFLISLFITTFYIYAARSSIFAPGIRKLIFILLAMNVLFSFMGVGMSITDRMVLYYSCINFIAIPHTYKCLNKSFLSHIYLFIILVVFFYISFIGSSYKFIENYTLCF